MRGRNGNGLKQKQCCAEAKAPDERIKKPRKVSKCEVFRGLRRRPPALGRDEVRGGSDGRKAGGKPS